MNTRIWAGLLTCWRLPCRVVSNLIKGMGADRMGGLAELDGFLQARPPQEMPVSSRGKYVQGGVRCEAGLGDRGSASHGCMQLAMTEALRGVWRCSGPHGLLACAVMQRRHACSSIRRQTW